MNFFCFFLSYYNKTVALILDVIIIFIEIYWYHHIIKRDENINNDHLSIRWPKAHYTSHLLSILMEFHILCWYKKRFETRNIRNLLSASLLDFYSNFFFCIFDLPYSRKLFKNMQQNDELLPFERVKMMKYFFIFLKAVPKQQGDAWKNIIFFS